MMLSCFENSIGIPLPIMEETMDMKTSANSTIKRYFPIPKSGMFKREENPVNSPKKGFSAYVNAVAATKEAKAPTIDTREDSIKYMEAISLLFAPKEESIALSFLLSKNDE